MSDKWKSPKLLHRLQHNAAVKAMSFCPWAPYLLATGAGSQDRTIRFWHTKSGTFLKKLDVKGQVTSVIWSKHKRQLVATFGFHDADNPILLAVYAFPQSLGGSNSTSTFKGKGRMMTGPKKSKRAANTLDVKSLSFVPGSGVPGGCGTRKTLNKPNNQTEKRVANIRFWNNDHYLLNSMPKLRKVATKPQGAGGLGYIPKPVRNGGAGTSLISSRFAHRYVNQGRIRSSLTTNIVSRINENNKSALYSQGNNSSRNYWNRADRPLLQVPTPSGLRVLSATASPDGSCICAAINDQTVRFFKLWSADEPQIPMQTVCSSYYEPHSSVWESKLIEFHEGIESIEEIIR